MIDMDKLAAELRRVRAERAKDTGPRAKRHDEDTGSLTEDEERAQATRPR